jgi:hypothetical protein
MESRLTCSKAPMAYRIGPALVEVRTRTVAHGWLARLPRPALKLLARLIAWSSARGPLRITTEIEVWSYPVPIQLVAVKGPVEPPAPLPSIQRALAQAFQPPDN